MQELLAEQREPGSPGVEGGRAGRGRVACRPFGEVEGRGSQLGSRTGRGWVVDKVAGLEVWEPELKQRVVQQGEHWPARRLMRVSL